MAINLDALLQSTIFDVWAIPVTFLPFVSQPLAGSYDRKGILNTYGANVGAEDASIYSDQRTILDIRESDFEIMPEQRDHVIIPFDCNGEPKGEYEIIDAVSDGGGQTCLTIRAIKTRR